MYVFQPQLAHMCLHTPDFIVTYHTGIIEQFILNQSLVLEFAQFFQLVIDVIMSMS